MLTDINVDTDTKVAVVKKAAKKATYIEPKVESFRRNKTGRKLMEQELSRLLVVDAERFKDRPIVDPTTKTIQTRKAKQLPAPMTQQHLIDNIYSYMLATFVQIRSPSQFAMKVHAEINRCGRELLSNPPSRHSLLQIVDALLDFKQSGPCMVLDAAAAVEEAAEDEDASASD